MCVNAFHHFMPFLVLLHLLRELDTHHLQAAYIYVTTQGITYMEYHYINR